MNEPAHFAQRAEEHPELPGGAGERVSGYGVMGLPFASGHVLGLRRWTASSLGEGFTSIWHRDPQGRWTFYESAPSEVACTRYFGADVEIARAGPIELEWLGPRRLHICSPDAAVEWTIEVASTPVTRIMSLIGSTIPTAAWRSHLVLTAMGHAAGYALRVGKVKLTPVCPPTGRSSTHTRCASGTSLIATLPSKAKNSDHLARYASRPTWPIFSGAAPHQGLDPRRFFLVG